MPFRAMNTKCIECTGIPKPTSACWKIPQRDAYQKPHEVLTALGIKQGEMIADIGAGSGYFTFRLAHHAGENGKVSAVDVNPDMILHLNRRIRQLKARNVVSILAATDDPLLSDHSVNRFFFCDSWHHIRAQTKYLSLVRKMLKPGGEVIMIDFHKRKQPVGPPLPMRIAREDLLQQMESHALPPQTRAHVFTVSILFSLRAEIGRADQCRWPQRLAGKARLERFRVSTLRAPINPTDERTHAVAQWHPAEPGLLRFCIPSQ